MKSEAGETRGDGIVRRDIGSLSHDFRALRLQCASERLWNPGDERSLMPVTFGVGWTQNLRSASHYPFQALLASALMLLRWRGRRRG